MPVRGGVKGSEPGRVYTKIEERAKKNFCRHLCVLFAVDRLSDVL